MINGPRTQKEVTPEQEAAVLEETLRLFGKGGKNWIEGDWEQLDEDFHGHPVYRYCSVGGINKVVLGSGLNTRSRNPLRSKVLKRLASVITGSRIGSAKLAEEIVIEHNDGGVDYPAIRKAFEAARQEALAEAQNSSRGLRS